MSNPLLEDLEWRGLIAQSTDRKELEQALAKPMSLYLGFDPTAPSLHVGNLVVLLVLRRFQLAGHRPIPLVGGATGLVGDPSGRNEERSLNDEQVVAEWVSKIKKQLEKIIDFSDKKTGAMMANNLDWTKPVSALEFLRDIGKHFSVNQMLAKDSVANRLATAGISYTEFSYQVLQAFDFLELYRRHECKLQIGGSDQWGNIVAGLDLIRKVEGGAAHALTVPLLAKADGSKFGKTAGGSGAVRAARRALAKAGRTGAELDHVNAHATSTPEGDKAELEAIRTILGEGSRASVTATKSAIGHTLGAAGGLGSIATICAMRDGRVHPTLNLTAPDPASAGLNIVTGAPASQQVNLALVNAFGFGGQNSALVFAKWEGK